MIIMTISARILHFCHELKKMAYLRFEWTPHLNERKSIKSMTNLLVEVSFLEPRIPPAVGICQGHTLQWLNRCRLLCRWTPCLGSGRLGLCLLHRISFQMYNVRENPLEPSLVAPVSSWLQLKHVLWESQYLEIFHRALSFFIKHRKN